MAAAILIYWQVLSGNITSKSDVGTYTYGTAAPWRPHAVTAVSGGSSQGAATYSYDANGSLVERINTAGGHQTLDYTSFNMVKKITQYYSGSLIQGTLEFNFNAEHQRVRQIRTKDGITTTTDYVHPDNQGGLLFEKVVSGSSTTYRHYINGGSGVTAVVITGSESRTEYWHKDHLGSVTVMTNESGAEIAGSRRAYDPWGKASVAGADYRGFTGHEQFDEFDLVHMNGRTYIAALGRFMSADPQIQFPHDLQSYNRYSYIENNPLGSTDPSGYGFLKSLFNFHSIITGEKWTINPIIQKVPVVGQIATIAATVVCSFFTAGAAGPACAAGMSAYMTYLGA